MSHQVDAGASVLTGVRLALVDLDLTVLPSVAWHAITLVASHISPTGGAIVTGLVVAVVHLAFAVAAGVVSWTFAEVSDASVDTVASVVAQFIRLDTSLARRSLAGNLGDVAVASRPASRALTNKGSISLTTAAAVLTGVRASAPVNRRLASVPGVTFGTRAAERLKSVLANPTVQTGLGVTLVHLVLTVGSCETGAAGAGVAIDFVCACPSIEARALRAVGDVRFAVDAGESRPTCASVRVHIVFARGPVLAWGALTFVDLQSTARPRESWQTTAVVGVHPISTGATIQTRIRRTVVNISLTVWPRESTSTCTDKAAKRICAGPTVFAWVAHTLVDIIVTQLALPPRLACALIAQVVRGVGADGVVGAGVGRAGGQDVSAGGASVGRLTDAGETGHTVHASPFV